MKVLISLIAISSLASVSFGQVTDSSYWSDGQGTTATCDVTDTNGAAPGGLTVTVTDHTGHTPPLDATHAPSSTQDKPKAQSSDEGQTNSPEPNEYRVKDGKLQKKNSSGKWVNMRKSKKPRTLVFR